MKEIKIKVGTSQYNVKVACSEEEREQGLQNTDNLPENEGMLFIFDEPDSVTMWMKDTYIPLDIIFINEDLEVKAIHSGNPLSEEYLTEENTLYVLEVNKGSNIKVGDEIDFLPSGKVKQDKMLVLDSEGKSQMELVGGERIFSRSNTKTLIRFAKKAKSSDNDKDYKALGKRVFKFLNEQDNRDPEYVESKN